MPAIIDSAPDCVVSEQVDGTDEASVTANGEDSPTARGNNYFSEETPCSGFMTFGPGSMGKRARAPTAPTWPPTWIGIAVMVVVLIMWMFLENRRLVHYVKGEPDLGIKEKT